jgi:hypothetical protein
VHHLCTDDDPLLMMHNNNNNIKKGPTLPKEIIESIVGQVDGESLLTDQEVGAIIAFAQDLVRAMPATF